MNIYTLTNFYLTGNRHMMDNKAYYVVNLTYTSAGKNEKFIQEREFDKLDEAIEYLKGKVDEERFE